MTFPVFASGDVLNASDMNGVGLWLVKSQAVGSGVASVTVTGAFPSDYDSFKIVYDGGVASTTLTLALTLGASATTYNMALPYVTYGAAVASGTSLTNSSSWALAGYGTANYVGMSMDLFSPNLARYTRIAGSYLAENEAGGYFGIHKTASAYTAFTLAVSTGTITGGTIRVYGYRN